MFTDPLCNIVKHIKDCGESISGSASVHNNKVIKIISKMKNSITYLITLLLFIFLRQERMFSFVI